MTAFVSLSGGLDSTAAALIAVSQAPGRVVGVGVDYGQRHRKELEAQETICATLGIARHVVDMTGMLPHGASLVEGGDVPHGHYAEASMSATVVQGRNLAFVAALVGLTRPDDQIWLGVHGGDHFVYPDCRPEFFLPLSTAVRAAYQVDMLAPFINADKTEVCRTFATFDRLDVAALTWSCYEGGDMHCGRCGTCVERAEAFDLAEVLDPTDYEDPNYWREVCA